MHAQKPRTRINALISHELCRQASPAISADRRATVRCTRGFRYQRAAARDFAALFKRTNLWSRMVVSRPKKSCADAAKPSAAMQRPWNGQQRPPTSTAFSIQLFTPTTFQSDVSSRRNTRKGISAEEVPLISHPLAHRKSRSVKQRSLCDRCGRNNIAIAPSAASSAEPLIVLRCMAGLCLSKLMEIAVQPLHEPHC